MTSSRAAPAAGRQAVNVMCVDVRDLFRTVVHDTAHSRGHTTAVTLRDDASHDGISERRGRWVKGSARNNVALPPVSPADPVVIEEVLRDPMPTLTGARPTAATMHTTRGAEFAPKLHRSRIPIAATMPSPCHLHRCGAEDGHQPTSSPPITPCVEKGELPDVSRDTPPVSKKTSTPSVVTPGSTLLLAQPLSALATEVVDNVLSRLQQRAAHKSDEVKSVLDAPPQRPGAADTQAGAAAKDVVPIAKPTLVSSMHIAPPRAAVQGPEPASRHWEYHSNELRRNKPRAFSRLICEAHTLPQQRYAWQREQMRRRRLNKPSRLQDSFVTNNLSSTMQSVQRSPQTPSMTNTLHGFTMPNGLTRVVPGPFRHRVATESSVPVTRRPKKC